MSQHEFYAARAAEAKRDAESATLSNVRERCLRSEAAWAEMASRAERGDKMRARLEAEKAEGGVNAPFLAAQSMA